MPVVKPFEIGHHPTEDDILKAIEEFKSWRWGKNPVGIRVNPECLSNGLPKAIAGIPIKGCPSVPSTQVEMVEFW